MNLVFSLALTPRDVKNVFALQAHLAARGIPLSKTEEQTTLMIPGQVLALGADTLAARLAAKQALITRVEALFDEYVGKDV